MYPTLHGVGREINLHGGHVITVTEAMQEACDTAIHSFILDDLHPGEGYKGRAINALEALRKELRAQVRMDEGDDTTRFGRARLARLAAMLSCWDRRTGASRSGWAVPVRSTMDIPLMPECAKHGLMHPCTAD